MRVTVERKLVQGSCSACGISVDGLALTVTLPGRGSESFCESCGEVALSEFRNEKRFRSNLRRKTLRPWRGEPARPDLAAEAEALTLDLIELDTH